MRTAKFDFVYQTLILTGKILIAVGLTSFAVALGPMVNSLISTFDAIRAVYTLVKVWRLRNSEKKKADAINSSAGVLTSIINSFYQFRRCQTVGLLYEQFQEQEAQLKHMENLSAKLDEDLKLAKAHSENLSTKESKAPCPDPALVVEQNETYKLNIYKYFRSSCSDDVHMCLNSFSENFIKDTLETARGETIINSALHWATQGPISSVSVASNAEDMAQLISIGI